MTTYKLIMPEHLNPYNRLFGGYLLQWVDETAWLAVSQDYPGCRFVTIALSEVVFHKGAPGGGILRFEVDRVKEGRTSVTYAVAVHLRLPQDPAAADEHIFSTQITFVRIGPDEQKLPLHAPVA